MAFCIKKQRVYLCSAVWLRYSAECGHQNLPAERKQGRDILYTLAGDPHLQVGDVISMTIDWHRRYRLMRLHLLLCSYTYDPTLP